MKINKVAGLTLAALALGLALGTVGSALAAPTSAATTGTGFTGAAIRMRDAGGRLIDVVAKLTGLTTDQVTEERQAGTSFSQIVAKDGVSSSELVAEALRTRQEILDQRVASGAITQAQADAALDRMKTRITARVDATDSSCDGTGGGAGCGGGGCGAGGGAGGGMRLRDGSGCGAAGGACTGACAQ